MRSATLVLTFLLSALPSKAETWTGPAVQLDAGTLPGAVKDCVVIVGHRHAGLIRIGRKVNRLGDGDSLGPRAAHTAAPVGHLQLNRVGPRSSEEPGVDRPDKRVDQRTVR